MALSLPKIGILSVGDMGMGIAKLLVSKGFSVATNGEGRSQATLARARSANVEVLNSDVHLVQSRPFILSVAPPRDALSIAQRIIRATRVATLEEPLYVTDLNAVSPATCRQIAGMFDAAGSPVRFVDGCIIGGPPKLQVASGVAGSWYVPSMPASGQHPLSEACPELAEALNMRHISAEIGAASGLKMCFATATKGFMGLGIQAFTTASKLGVAGELRREMREAAPGLLDFAERSIPLVPPKSYRWVREMEEISDTHRAEGGFETDNDVFRAMAELYRIMAEDPVLGAEKVEDRKRGETVNDLAVALAEGLASRKKCSA
ncbi:6-phosphogluconate dehydrogenase [Colletotrichum tofieldiae]|uniref:6-phosphogluconate dehydrogenase n=1 Tax=Colletotrichum tofieldiae TaxID=708197 RepID=A0A166WTJ2_9PEZI|nr:6-phosphogluconate dehydrogenase [Colletotrichum tofieldiae]GKT54266.1 6-phosphogluconate dehydrogenase [Colletotrichum tofieldiae]GKT73989.1 6-phosphogluconate dehydrogenase [Colletotrichum tofieldiae]